MPLPKDGEVQLFQVVDTDGNPARVSLIAGVYRLAVDALLVGPAGAYAQGDFDSINVDEANALAMWVRAANTGLDTTQVVGSRNVPIAARGALAAQAYTLERLLGDTVVRGDDGATYSAIGTRAAVAAQAYGLQRLLTDGVIRVDDGTTYSAMAGRGAVAAQAYTLIRGLTDAVVRGDDGATYSAIAARNYDTDSDVAAALIGLIVNSRLAGYRRGTADWARLYSDIPGDVSGGIGESLMISLYTIAQTFGRDSTGAAVYRPVEARVQGQANAGFEAAQVGLYVNARQRSGNSKLTATAAAGSAVTLTIPAVASQRANIVQVRITKFATALLVAGAAPLIVTTTNLSAIAWDFPDDAEAAGATESIDLTFPLPMQGDATNVATTIVCPARATVIWRISAVWYDA